jgi:uncharacterized protein (TIGR01777 family)
MAGHFRAQGCETVVLTRSPNEPPIPGSAREAFWDGHTLGKWMHTLESADVLINLAGRSVDCRYHARNRRLMMDSRIESNRVLGVAVARCGQPPRVWLNSSTATIYKHTFGPPWDERGKTGGTPEAKDAFSVELATAWEQEFNRAMTPRTRKVALRTAMVFGHGPNSVFPTLRRLVRSGLGGQMAGGRQYVSWIHAVDLCRALDWIIEHEDVSGPINLAAPNPVTNREMMSTLRELCGVRFGLPATTWMLEAGAFLLRTETELIIKSRRVVPGRLLADGFHFRFTELRDAMADLLARRPA